VRAAYSKARAAASFWWLGLIAAGLSAFSIIGIVLGLRSLIISTVTAVGAIECCGTIFSSCLVSPSMSRATLPWVAMGILCFGVFRALRNGWATLRTSRSFVGSLRIANLVHQPKLCEILSDLGLRDHVQLVDDGSHRAFTAGLLSPRIYVTRGLCEALSRDELKSVILHEDRHRQSLDPLRAFIILLLQDLFFFLPIGHALGRIFFEAQEEAADDSVAESGGDSLELASALCRVARLESSSGAGVVPGILGGGGVERRVRRMLSPHRGESERPSSSVVLGSMFVCALLLITLYLPLLMSGSPFEFQGCNSEFCRGMGCLPR
jgi:Zn-dependent protease with chaperone function